MPEPNLLPLNLNKFDVDKLKLSIPELPNVTRNHLISKYGLDIRKISILMVLIKWYNIKVIYVFYI